MPSRKIPITQLIVDPSDATESYSISPIENNIEGIEVVHVSIPVGNEIEDSCKKGYRTIYLFVKGNGVTLIDGTSHDVVSESILLPNAIQKMKIQASESKLHYLKISCQLSDQDHIDLDGFPKEHTQEVYFKKFSDCQSYSEPIKSPNTISRTILPNKIIPRIAMGTVHTQGPDKVGAHEHPMLEQLFLGLADNNSIVYADEEQQAFSEYSLLHIPLGSRHSVSVDRDQTLYYVWMDFFLDSKGEEWLQTHIEDEENR